MKVHLHASCWNEERMLPYFFRHYDSVVDEYFIHDNDSSDRSLEILAAHPRVTVLPLVLEGDSMCGAAFEMINDLWKGSRGNADWVAVCNIDEFFWHPDLRWYLEACRRRGITYLPSRGYNIVTDEFPSPGEDLAATYRMAVRSTNFDKPSFFHPDEIVDSGFGMGRHTAEPKGNVVVPRDQELLLLHFKHLGLEYVSKRHAELHERMRPKDVEKKWGFHYDADLTKRNYAANREAARHLSLPHRGRGRKGKWKRRIPRVG
ncbi:MAG: glycosyltransferase family 2 protein [Verrucomicrobiota bacterium]